MSNIISVEYEVLASVKVDMDTGEVVDVVAHTEQFNLAAAPLQVYAGGHSDDSLPEYLPEDHPLRVRALEIADRVSADEVQVPFKVSA